MTKCVNCNGNKYKCIAHLHQFETEYGLPNYRVVYFCRTCYKHLKEEGLI
jgi:hypothetical protein